MPQIEQYIKIKIEYGRKAKITRRDRSPSLNEGVLGLMPPPHDLEGFSTGKSLFNYRVSIFAIQSTLG